MGGGGRSEYGGARLIGLFDNDDNIRLCVELDEPVESSN